MEILENFDLSQVLYYKIGPKVKYLLKVQNEDDLFFALDFIKKNNIKKVLPVGLGSNLLICNEYFDGAVILFIKPVKNLISLESSEIIKVFSSHLLDDLIKFSFKNNLKGLGFAGGLPGTIGGAVRGNAGCFGHEIKDIFHKAQILDVNDPDFELKELNRDLMNFSYRHSVLKDNKNLIILNAFFKLEKAGDEEMQNEKNEYEKNIEYRKNNHPIEYPSCGSVFQNVTDKKQVEKIISIWGDVYQISKEKWHNKVAVGFIINRLGFKGYQVGGAQVSEKHANYIVNKGGAKYNDVLTIIKLIKDKFHKTFGFDLKTEVEIVA